MNTTYCAVRKSFDQLLAKRQVLNAVHRSIGCGNIMENTCNGYLAGFRCGADLVELDLAATTDGTYFLIHDGMERRLFGQDVSVLKATEADFARLQYYNPCAACAGHPQKVFDVLPKLRGLGLFNIDRSWRYWGGDLLERLAKLDLFEQILLKCPAEDETALSALEQSQYPFMFMPIVRKAADLQALYKRKVNLVAAELLFDCENHELIDPEFIAEVKAHQVAPWMNAIVMSNHEAWSNISAYHDDDGAVLDNADANWGWLIDRGAQIIQTDWPTLLYNYLQKRFPASHPALF